jgi:Leucine-rich repeat (LRR) protein
MRTLALSGTGVTGAGLVHLKNMARLEDLRLDGLPIRGGDLANLSGLTNLKDLDLPGERLTDAGLAHLGSLTNLETLGIEGEAHPSAITSRGLAHLASLRKLKHLDILGSKVESLEPIRQLTWLEEIHIEDSDLDDAGLAPLSGFGDLKVLDLDRNPKITDAVLARLTGLKKLSSLSLSGTETTQAGIAALKAKRPKLYIAR